MHGLERLADTIDAGDPRELDALVAVQQSDQLGAAVTCAPDDDDLGFARSRVHDPRLHQLHPRARAPEHEGLIGPGEANRARRREISVSAPRATSVSRWQRGTPGSTGHLRHT